jgi:hypothetical protein
MALRRRRPLSRRPSTSQLSRIAFGREGAVRVEPHHAADRDDIASAVLRRQPVLRQSPRSGASDTGCRATGAQQGPAAAFGRQSGWRPRCGADSKRRRPDRFAKAGSVARRRQCDGGRSHPLSANNARRPTDAGTQPPRQPVHRARAEAAGPSQLAVAAARAVERRPRQRGLDRHRRLHRIHGRQRGIWHGGKRGIRLGLWLCVRPGIQLQRLAWRDEPARHRRHRASVAACRRGASRRMLIGARRLRPADVARPCPAA